MFSLAYAVSATITGLAREAQLPALYVFAGFGIVSILMVPFMRMAPAVVEDDGTNIGGYPFWPILLSGGIVLVAFMSEATVEAWSALHIERTLGGGAAEGALGPAMLGFTMAFGRFSGQAVSERMRDINLLIIAACISAGGAIMAAIAVSPMMAYAGFGVFGLGISVMGPIGLAIVGRLVPPHLRTEAISKVAVLGFSGFFFAPVLMGLASEAFGLRVAFGCVAAVVLLCVPLALTVTKMPRADGRV